MNADGARVAWELLGSPVWPPAGVIVRRHVSGVYVPARGERIRGAS